MNCIKCSDRSKVQLFDLCAKCLKTDYTELKKELKETQKLCRERAIADSTMKQFLKITEKNFSYALRIQHEARKLLTITKETDNETN